MEAGMLSILRDCKNSKLQLTSEGASVLAYAGLTCSTTLFYATALINNGWLCFVLFYLSLSLYRSSFLFLSKLSVDMWEEERWELRLKI